MRVFGECVAITAGIWYNNIRDSVKGGLCMDYRIDLLWDPDACVWVATSVDVPGLVLESGSYDALIERVRYAIPELLELNSPQTR